VDNPRQHIGKFVCYDGESGSCWAKISDVVKINLVTGQEEVFIVKDRVWSYHGRIMRKSEPTVVVCKNIKETDIFGGEVDDALAEVLFQTVLASDGTTAMELGGNDLVRMLDEHLNKKEEKDVHS